MVFDFYSQMINNSKTTVLRFLYAAVRHLAFLV